MSKVRVLTDSEFEEGLGSAWLLVAFCASWCQPSRQLMPSLEATADEFEDRLRVAVADVEAAPHGASQCRIQGYPTCVLFEDEREVDRLQGLVDGAALRDWLSKALGRAD